MNPTTVSKTVVLSVLALVIAVLSVTTLSGMDASDSSEDETGFDTFESESAFQAYMSDSAGQQRTVLSQLTRLSQATPQPRVAREQTASPTAETSTSTSSQVRTPRQTNTQESSVGEPDVVKLTKSAVYYTPENSYSPVGLRGDVRSKGYYPVDEETNTHVLSVDRPSSVEKRETLAETGDTLLRNESRLVIYNDSTITGYDIQDTAVPERVWQTEINESMSVETARRIDGQAYFVLEKRTRACPVQPLARGPSIGCTNIYRPGIDTAVDTVYTALSIEMDSGDIGDKISFVGSSQSSTVYMSEGSLYVAYTERDIVFNDIIDHVITSDTVSLDQATTDELRHLQTLDISTEAKTVEFRNILGTQAEPRTNRQSSDRQSAVRESISQFMNKNKRDIYTTTVVEIEVNGTELTDGGVGTIPGEPLNQFSLDERDGRLRVATTIPRRLGVESSNDAYVLDESLNIQGAVQGMSDGQRIYSARFIGEKGYLITYRQVDPLHVIDFSDPSSPAEVGTLELPGFSRYLHDVGDGKLLGIGQSENRQLKAVLFDVSDPTNPTVADSVTYETEYSSEVAKTHKAFQNDKQNNRVYIPTSNGLRVVNYADDGLRKEAFVDTESAATRTRLLNDSVYIFHGTGVVSVNRETHDVTSTLNLSE